MKKIFSLFILIMLWLSQSAFVVIGHRGDPINYPEETFASFDSAFKNGANFVELDLHLSKDKQLIISHDKNLERITGTNAIVSQNNLTELQQMYQANGEPIHTLDELFSRYQDNPDAKFLIETKKTKKNNPIEMEDLLVATIKKYHMENRVMLQSFNSESLKKLHHELPQIPVIFIIGSLKKLNFDVLQYINGVNISSKLISQKLIDKLHRLNLKVYVWDEMNEDEKQWNWVVNLPIDGVITNYALTGYQYQLAKSGSENFTINKDAVVASDTQTPIYENPYQKIATDKSLPALAKVHLSRGIKINNQTYYQISNEEFIPSDAVNLNLTQQTAAKYLNKSVINYKDHPVALFDGPSKLSRLSKSKLNAQQTDLVEAVNFNSETAWFKLKNGWVNANDVLIMNLNPKDNPHHLNNLLLIDNPVISISVAENNFFNNLFIFSTQLSNFNARI